MVRNASLVSHLGTNSLGYRQKAIEVQCKNIAVLTNTNFAFLKTAFGGKLTLK